MQMALTVETCCVPHLRFFGDVTGNKREKDLLMMMEGTLYRVYCTAHYTKRGFFLLYASSPSYIYQRETASLVCIIYSVEKNNFVKKEAVARTLNPEESVVFALLNAHQSVNSIKFQFNTFGNMFRCVLRFHLSQQQQQKSKLR